jgi:ABC-2 type transport system ATP-binding protein
MKQRLAIARALLANPPVLLLDEPTIGLDPQSARNLREFILEIRAEGRTILLTTHYMEEADQLCDRVGIIDSGTIIALDTPASLKRSIHQLDVLQLELENVDPALCGAVSALPAVEHVVAHPAGTDGVWSLALHTTDSPHRGRGAGPRVAGRLRRAAARHRGHRLFPDGAPRAAHRHPGSVLGIVREESG